VNKLHWSPPLSPTFGGAIIGAGHFQCMENTSTRNAFWNSWIERDSDGKWLAVWKFGRIGSAGKAGYRAFNGEVAALGWLKAKREEKKAGGYVVQVGVEQVGVEAVYKFQQSGSQNPCKEVAGSESGIAKKAPAQDLPPPTEVAKPVAFDPLEVLLC
jgi:hypothetical protein